MNPSAMNPTLFTFEIVFTAIIIILCLYIYFRTSEISSLSKHKGIYYFRLTFLFLGLAYLFRLLLMSLSFSISRGPDRFYGMQFGLVFVGFLSTLALIFLFYSTSWKYIKRYRSLIAVVIAVLISVLAYLTQEPIILVMAQAALLIIAALLSMATHKKNKKFSKLITIYLLMMIFWIVGLIPLSTRRLLPYELVPAFHVISFAVFLIIFFKVQKIL